MKLLRRLIALLLFVSPLSLTTTPARADDPTVNIVQCVRLGGVATVPGGSALTLRVAWTMSTRGNLVDFINASTAMFTLGGTSVVPTASDPLPFMGVPDFGDGSDGWTVVWSANAFAPAAGQSVVWTAMVSLSRQVADHEGGLGKPAIIPAGVLFHLRCTITGS